MTIPISPIIPIFIKKFMFTPEINNSEIIDITIITPVPKSGWSMMRPNIKITIDMIGKTDDLISLILLFDKYFDVKIINPNLAASLG